MYWGYSLDDLYDDCNEPGQPRCERCGRWLPWKPNGRSHVKVGQEDYETYDDDYNPQTFTLVAEIYQPVIGWECRCGNFQGEIDDGPEEKKIYDPPLVGDWRPVEGKPGTMQVVWR